MERHRSNNMSLQEKNQVLDFELLFESAPHLYLVLDTDFIIVGVTNAYLKATMVERTSIMGKNIFDVFPDNPNDPKATGVKNLKASLEQVRTDQCSDTMAIQKYDIRSPSGHYEERYWSPINRPILDNGKLRYILHCVEDVTEFVKLKQSDVKQLKLTEELRTRAGEMEIEIYQRAQEVQEINKKLQEANQNLARLAKVKTQFFTNLSHELRTPLMLILGALNNLLKTTSSAKELNELKRIQNNSRILLKHIKELLDVAKIEAGKMNLYYTNADFTALIYQIKNLFQAHIDEHHIHFSMEMPEKLAISFDSEKIQRVLMQIFSNAIRFTPDFGHIHVRLEHNTHTVTCVIKDSGPGILPSAHETIFERFFQAEQQNDDYHQNNGLGLSICKDFIELHHGHIKADNAKEGGAIFTIKLPLKAPANETIHATANEPESFEKEIYIQQINEFKYKKIPTKYRTDGNSDLPLILVVEDNLEMNEFICTILSENYRTVSAFNGEEGLQKARDYHPHLIISDILMPKLNGIQMVHRLRQDNQFISTPIVILTAKDDDVLCEQMLKEGAQDYLTKPVSPGVLNARIANLILAKKSEDELERFIYLTSHDLKAPLPAIKNLINWIGEDAGEHLPEQSKKHLSLLQHRASRMSNLLDGLYTYFQAGHVDKEIFMVEANSLINELKNELDPKHLFRFECEKLPAFPTHKLQLRHVFSILIENSIKHHMHQQGFIHIGVIDDFDYFKFFVQDDGPGIEKAYHHKIFELFQTLKSRDVKEGNGLGLCIAKKIVESYGGKITLESKKNQGAIFYFTWPKHQKETLDELH